MKVTAIFMFVITTAVAKHHHSRLRQSVLEYKDNFFDKINRDLHILMEKIFDSINLAANFTKRSNVQILLTMHYDLSNIANKNFDVFNEIENITKSDIGNRTKRKKLDNVLEKLFIEKHYNVYDQLKEKQPKSRQKKIKSISRSKIKMDKNISSVFDDSQEFMNFATDFWRKVSNLNKTDFKTSSENGVRVVSPTRNLKAWVPPSSIEISANSTQTRRIYRGTKTKVKTFPFVVSIHIMGEFSCAGCIISRDLVITAASCLQIAFRNNFFEENPKSIYVRLGSDYTFRSGEMIPVRRMHFHPMFDPDNLRHNLAIVILERRIRFSKQQKKIRRILWDRTPEQLSADTDGVLILGWGATKTNQRVKKHQKLTVDTLKVYNIDDCRQAYSKNFVSDEHFCAGFVRTSAGACNGDIGGPGVVGAVLVGIISFGAPLCGAIDTPTVFTKLGFYTPWIESILNPSRIVDTRRKHSQILNHNHHHNSSFLKKRFRANEDYPEEVKILREVLNELIRSDSTVVDELLYGDLYNDFHDIFESTEKVETYQHPLANLSLFPLNASSEVGPSTIEYVTIPLTTSATAKPIPKRTTIYTISEYHSIPGTIGNLDATRKTQYRILTKNSDKTREVRESNEKDNYYTDNYEDSTEDDNGMSIEIPSNLAKINSKDYSTNAAIIKVTIKKEQLMTGTEPLLKTTSSYKIDSNSKKYTRSNKEESYETGEGSDKKEKDTLEEETHQKSDISCESSYKKNHDLDDENSDKKHNSDETSHKKKQNLEESDEHSYHKKKYSSDSSDKSSNNMKDKSISDETSEKLESHEVHEDSNKKEHTSEQIKKDFDVEREKETKGYQEEESDKMDSHETTKVTPVFQPILDIGGLSFGLAVDDTKTKKGNLRKKKRHPKITETSSDSKSDHKTTIILIPQGPAKSKNNKMLKASLVIKYNKKV